ncbi:glutathione S-transferase [Lingula anatina]|uniref:Glutathione S-transferase n=1 Tax=Lingula anatina TaxID=7574 RepID=A0A1S3IBW7_LINAN|nr:glutathione S-transferase [Lingula anatina]XP_013395750.1 glutathione S-transferase [Lingula anatina]|eukprot:XP_013395749.1 glutathione S-transferase [Lingula anatina]
MSSSSEWVLYYWPLAGRGEFVRLVFEEAGVPYKEINDVELLSKNFKKIDLPPSEDFSFPCFAPPVIKKGDFVLSQTPVICEYLGKKFGLYPDGGEEEEYHARQFNLTIHDFIADGRLAFHGRNHTESYYTQKEETQTYIDFFVKNRLPKWLRNLEHLLNANYGKHGGKGYAIGTKMTYVDLALLHVLRATESQFPAPWEELKGSFPLCREFKERMSQRPNLAAYFKSDRCRPFEGNSMM